MTGVYGAMITFATSLRYRILRERESRLKSYSEQKDEHDEQKCVYVTGTKKPKGKGAAGVTNER